MLLSLHYSYNRPDDDIDKNSELCQNLKHVYWVQTDIGDRKVHIYLEYTTVSVPSSPLARIGTPPHPLTPQRVCPPPLDGVRGS
jgi:hypothetical protein